MQESEYLVQQIANLRYGPGGRACRFHAARLRFAVMPIPPLAPNGFLPVGVHECMLDEIQARFGSFQGSERRPQLWTKLQQFLREAKASGLVEAVLLNGSFVTDEPAPNDIDIIVVVSAAHDFGADLPPHQYNVLAQQRVRRRFGFDIVVAKIGTDNLAEAVAFFTQVRQRPGLKKGLVRVTL